MPRAAGPLLVATLVLTGLLSACSDSGNSLATVTQGAPPAVPRSGATRARPDATRFSKNFFAAFPLVRVRINGGEPLEFLFDTGNAGRSVLDISVAQRLGLDLAPSGSISFAGITLPTLRAEATRFQILNGGRRGAIDLRGISFDALDLAPFGELAGRRVDGILGYDVIHRFVTTVDYERQTVSFGAPRPEPALGRQVVPFTLRQGWIIVKTRVNGGEEEEMILDTGASLTTFSRERARRLGLDVSRARPTTLMLPIGRVTYLPHRLRQVEFAGRALADSAAVVVATREGLFTSGTETSLLGANVLRHFRLTIDYGRRQLLVEPHQSFKSDPDEYTSIGVLPKLRDGRFYVSGVVNSSPADEEGIEIGDEIVELGGLGVDQYSFGGLVDALRGPENSEVDLTLQRGQRRIALRLKRVKLL